MGNRQTAIRKDVKFILSELIKTNLDIGEFVDMADWAEITGFSETQLRTEIKRQADLMTKQAGR